MFKRDFILKLFGHQGPHDSGSLDSGAGSRGHHKVSVLCRNPN